ncbi:MAG: DUF2332 domain-containing protein [Sphingopyxis sp.]|nr:DUF2332 domain-containing protein [Sphingopyxis sp.]
MESNLVAAGIEFQAQHCAHHGAPITASIVRAMLPLMADETAVARRVRDWPGLPLEDAMPLRFAGGLHHLHLSEAEPRLAPLYAGALADQAAVDALVAAVVADHDAALLPWFDGPPQTNEAGRSASLMAGLLWLAQHHGPRVEISEVGASAGINTMMERYHFNLGGIAVGPVASPMQIQPEWRGAAPPADPVDIVEIAGCDVTPVDLSDPDAALRVKAYVWPDAPERLVRMDAAILLATQRAPDLVAADAADWTRQRLARPQTAGVTRVIQHSIVWQYLGDERRAAITAMIEAAGAQATPERPLAWQMLETNRATFLHELTVRHWPGDGTARVLGHAHAHGAWVEWLG